MILEGIVTTRNIDGSTNIAPMGPRFGDDPAHFLLRPYPTSQTYRNLARHGEGVLHVIDNVLLLAKAALGPVEAATFPAQVVQGDVLTEACRWLEFRVRYLDTSEPRVHIEAEIVHRGQLRDFFGLNRAMFAVVEAAILATRTDFLPLGEIEAEYRKLAILVEKTGGSREREAFALLSAHLACVSQQRGKESREPTS